MLDGYYFVGNPPSDEFRYNFHKKGMLLAGCVHKVARLLNFKFPVNKSQVATLRRVLHTVELLILRKQLKLVFSTKNRLFQQKAKNFAKTRRIGCFLTSLLTYLLPAIKSCTVGRDIIKRSCSFLFNC